MAEHNITLKCSFKLASRDLLEKHSVSEAIVHAEDSISSKLGRAVLDRLMENLGLPVVVNLEFSQEVDPYTREEIFSYQLKMESMAVVKPQSATVSYNPVLSFQTTPAEHVRADLSKVRGQTSESKPVKRGRIVRAKKKEPVPEPVARLNYDIGLSSSKCLRLEASHYTEKFKVLVEKLRENSVADNEKKAAELLVGTLKTGAKIYGNISASYVRYAGERIEVLEYNIDYDQFLVVPEDFSKAPFREWIPRDRLENVEYAIPKNQRSLLPLDLKLR